MSAMMHFEGHWIPHEMTSISTADIPLLAAAVVAHALYRITLSNFILRPLAVHLQLKRIEKFVHRSFDCIHYLLSGIIGTWALLQRPYGHCSWSAFDCGSHMTQHSTFEVSGAEKVYFMLFLCYYIVDIAFIWTGNEVITFTIHHVVTIAMILSVVVCRAPGVALTVMLLHDLTDIPLYLGKVLLYLGFNLIKDVFLLSFVAICTWLRIINFPFIIYHTYMAMKLPMQQPGLWFATTSGLVCLYVLHLVWEWKIWTNIRDIIQGKGVRDNRSE